MKKSLITILITTIIGVVILNIWFYIMQPGMLFYPYMDLEQTPADWGLPFEDVRLTTEDGISLHGWYIPAKGSDQTLLFFHGNAGNISHRGDSLEIFHRLGLNVLIVDYRGYGQSKGTISESGFYLDAMAAWTYLTKKRNFQPGKIVLYGRSMGGAVAVNLASQVQAKALIIESTFSSVRDMANVALPVLSRFVLLRYDFDSLEKIRQVRSPLMVIHSIDDELIPYAFGQKLFTAAGSEKQFYTMHGGHNDGFILSQPGYEQAIRTFLSDQ